MYIYIYIIYHIYSICIYVYILYINYIYMAQTFHHRLFLEVLRYITGKPLPLHPCMGAQCDSDKTNVVQIK